MSLKPDNKTKTPEEIILEALVQLSKAMSEAAEPEKKQRSNNWLKLHGLPMRRKGKGRKKHE